ncbi:MAG TPA: universal stress protein [Verrucomicrobiae bacterium]|jgi:nucleotide-binding universal stress UspA family protein|nr:universal stress protein [Verrucomicrobiae bacterium]
MATKNSVIRRIVVGVEGSESSTAALKWTARLAKTLGSQVIAVYAVDVPAYYPEPYGLPVQFDTEWRAAIESEFENKWCKPLKAAGVKYRAVIEDGRAASVITDVADRENADIVVVGRRGRSGVAELLLGSTSHELVLHSRRPVLVISAKSAA